MRKNIGTMIQAIAMLLGLAGVIFTVITVADIAGIAGRINAVLIWIMFFAVLPAILMISMLVFGFGKLIDITISMRDSMGAVNEKLQAIEEHIHRI